MLDRIGDNFLQLFVVLAFKAMIEGVAGRLKGTLQSKRLSESFSRSATSGNDFSSQRSCRAKPSMRINLTEQ